MLERGGQSTRDELIVAGWGIAEDSNDPVKLVTVNILRLRDALEKIGWTIVAPYKKKKYWLTQLPKDA